MTVEIRGNDFCINKFVSTGNSFKPFCVKYVVKKLNKPRKTKRNKFSAEKLQTDKISCLFAVKSAIPKNNIILMKILVSFDVITILFSDPVKPSVASIKIVTMSIIGDGKSICCPYLLCFIFGLIMYRTCRTNLVNS